MEDRAWYVVQTSPGFESVVKRNLERRIESMKMTDKIFNVLVPEQIEIEKKKNGELKENIVRPYSGYVFIDMIVTDETWFMVRNTPSVTGFLGSSGGGAKPVPLQIDEIAPILKMCGISQASSFNGKVGDKVRIMSGSFSGQEGVISAVDESKEIVKVLIEGFGGQATLELGYQEVKLLKE